MRVDICTYGSCCLAGRQPVVDRDEHPLAVLEHSHSENPLFQVPLHK